MRLIDADEVLARIENPYQKAEIARWLRDAPTIERKKGKWEQDNPFTKPRCSECGEPCFGLHGLDYTVTPYCPNCGADMRGEKDG